MKNLSAKSTEDNLNELFVKHGEVDRVKKIKDYAFIHFKEREDAMKVCEINNSNDELSFNKFPCQEAKL